MGARRLTGIVGQTTLGETAGLAPPDLPTTDPLPPPKEGPAPRVDPGLASSSAALRERQLRWFKERERRRASAEPPAPPIDPEGLVP
ncbi:MAG: hypothetical protein L3J92_00365 [Thermoplasmata archaeon]|jgi:hypothetical protein|nr:hypothetical protein [Thermoplasmata archaeon]